MVVRLVRRWHGGWISDWDLERRDVERRHIVLASTFILVINYVLPNVVVRIGIFNLSFPSPVVNDEHENQDCLLEEKCIKNSPAIINYIECVI